MVQPHGGSPGGLVCPTAACSAELPWHGCCTEWVLPRRCSRALPLAWLWLHQVMPKRFTMQLSRVPRQGQDARADLGQGARCRWEGHGARGEAGACWGSLAATLAPRSHAAVVPTACLSSRSPRPLELPSSFSSQIYGLIWSSNSLGQRLHQSLPGTTRHIGAVASARESSNNH